MIELSLAALPNQQFSVTLEGGVFDVTLKEANGIMAATVSRNNAVLIEGSRVLPFQPIIPFPYLENGNLFVSTENEELPYYTAFGITQFMFYLTEDELAGLRA